MSHSFKKRTGKVTQAMIARECGVSQTLVSIVLSNGSNLERIAESTRQRILKTAEELGYQVRNAGARKNTLALILPFVQRSEGLDHAIYEGIEEFYARTQRFAAAAAYRHGYSLIARPYEASTELTHWLSEWNVDGVLWHAKDDRLHDWITQRYPTSQLHFSASPHTDAATVNQEELPVLGLDYLYERGHRRIAFMPGQSTDCPIFRRRTAAFLDRAAELNLPGQTGGRFCISGASTAEMVERALELMKLPEDQRPTAVVGGDPFVLELARELQGRGIRIPDDISLLGIDNISAGAFYNPRLSSIDVCQMEVAETAVEMVIARIADPTRRYQKVYISPKVIERESVKTLAAPAKTRLAESNR